MSSADRVILEEVAKSSSAPLREMQRARVLLTAADGQSHLVNARQHQVTAMTVRSWRRRFAQQGLKDFGKVAAGRGRKSTISEQKVAEIIHKATSTTPKGKTHWSVRDMAKETGVSPATVQRIWSEVGI